MRPFWLTLGLRELRGGLADFRAFLACLALGVGAVAAVGSVIAAVGQGLSAEGRQLLGGDVSIAFTYRFAEAGERAWMQAQAAGGGALSEVVDLRSMLGPAAGEDERALAQVRAVDAAYPLVGAVRLSAGMKLAQALAPRDGVPGLVAARVLAERLGLAPGDRVRLAGAEFFLRAVLDEMPDHLGPGPAIGPRVIVRTEDLRAAGLLGPGTLFTTLYRLRRDGPAGPAELAALEAAFRERFPDSGARWRDTRAAAPGVGRFVDRIGAFLTLTALAALAVGAVGVGAAVRGYLDRKTRTIAALRALGAGGREIFAAYAFQIGVIAAFGIALGLALGAGAALVIGPLIAGHLPVPAVFAVYPGPLGVAALYGALTAALFTLWPLARLRGMRPALLFRDLGEGAVWPRGPVLGAVAAIGLALGAAVVGLSGAPELALWVIGAVAAGFVALRGLGVLARRGARRLA
ncbi:MAG TPA: FtsX-like permease family protein, partial [Thermohalobaculum sp.]|nr:FtsX-like permease family protein [Thermohalobaculum sp.]